MTRDAAKAAFDAARAEVALRTAEEEEATRRLEEAHEGYSAARAALARVDAEVWIDRCREAHPTPAGAREWVRVDQRTCRPTRSLRIVEGRTARGALRMRTVVYEPEEGPLADPSGCTWVGIRSLGERRWTARRGTREWHEINAALDAGEVER